MNILTILLLSATAAVSHANENTLNLRGGDIQNNFIPEERELSDTCVSRSAYLGCYENRNQNRALPHEIGGRPHTARECEEACANKGFLYFAREWRGQCFCSNTDDYNKHGTATNCNCCGTNVGANKMCVYKLQTAEAPYPAAPGCTDRFNAAPYMGCYVDRNRRRALPHEVHGRGYSAEDCHVECNKAGYKYFARQWRGQCFCGNHDYDKYGPASNCNCCGRSVGANKMCVWEGDGAGTPPTEAATTTTTTTDAPLITTTATTDAPITATQGTEAAGPFSTTPGSQEEDDDSNTIVDVAVAAGVFNTLVKAVAAAGLVDALTAEGPLTVLAPTDDAFAKLPDGTLDELLLPENIDRLRNILLTHVIDGEVDSSVVTFASGPVNATTLSGYTIEAVANVDGSISVNVNDSFAKVILADVYASNGIVHAIDGVLLPPDVDE
mmetsp:Transcript_7986/g.12092  ORF Transcript_7986/g.12092 Transcript_7986/m.12092 type:complete len:440 (+) Transcript_7986:246-1565(+)